MDFNLDQRSLAQQPILRSKLQRPRQQPNTIRRDRLITQLERGPRQKLTLLSAPAGYGKTTLLHNWAVSQQAPLAWLTVDEEDNHTSRFARYLQAAWLQREGGSPVERPVSHGQDGRVPLDQLLPILINQVEAAGEPVTFVFDDLHHLNSSAVLEAISFLIDNLPAQARIIIASRSDPELGLARLRAYGQLEELRGLDLRFNREEIEKFVELQIGQPLPQAEMDELVRKTEGWPAGLQLIMHLLKGHHQLAQIIDGFRGDHPFVFEYLTGEVLNELSPELRGFLLKTSILPHLDASLCDQVLERDDSQQLLGRIRAENLFLEPMDPAQSNFRYHPLFRDYLQEQLTNSYEPAEKQQLHRRACQALRSRGRAQLAIPHAVQAHDYETAVQLIGEHAQQAMYVGDSASIQRWLSWLPEEYILDNYQLAIWHTWALAVSGRLEGIDHWLSHIARERGPDEDSSVSIQEARYHGLTIQATVSRFRGDTARAIQEANYALEILPDDRPVLEAVVLLNQGHANLLCGKVSTAIPLLKRATDLARNLGHRYVAISAQYHLGKCYLARGEFDKAELTFSRADQPLGAEDEHGLRCVNHLGQALLEMEQDKLDQAGRNLEHAIRLSQIIHDFIFMREAMEARVRLDLLLGDEKAARRSLQNLQKLRQHMGASDPSVSIDGLQARVDLLAGYQATALEWAKKQLATQFQAPNSSHRALIQDALAIYFSAEERSTDSAFDQQVSQMLNALAAQAIQDQRLLDWVRFELLSITTEGEELQETSLPRLRALIERSQLVGLQAHLAGAPRLWHLWKRVHQSHRAQLTDPNLQSKLERLIEAHQARFEDQVLNSQQAPSEDQELPENLSAREAQVLRLLAEGKSSRQVAEALVITYNTVRTHIRNIYRKLDVHSRLEAIQRAQELQVV